jgi:hypothetical protein
MPHTRSEYGVALTLGQRGGHDWLRRATDLPAQATGDAMTLKEWVTIVHCSRRWCQGYLVRHESDNAAPP